MQNRVGDLLSKAIRSERGVAIRQWLGLRGVARSNHELHRVAVPAEVIVYFGEVPTKMYQLDQWLPVLEKLDQERSVLLVFRKVGTMRAFKGRTPLRSIFVRRFEDLTLLYDENDYKLGIYVNNGVTNFQSLSFARMVHVHVNHGESDKISMVSNQAKAYDRIMIAGTAALERHRSVLVDFDEKKLQMIGRPQLDFDFEPELQRTDIRTVMYAPTWEGENEANNYTSLDLYGESIIDALIALPESRIIYKPHPRVETSSSPQIRAAHESIVSALEVSNKSRSNPHIISEQGNILAMLHAVDALVSDVSSVGLDYLYLHPERPLLMTDRRNDRGQLEIDSPVTRACPVIDGHSVGDLRRLITASLTQDAFGGARAELRRLYFGGFEKGESTDAFVSAVSELISERKEKLKEYTFHASSPEAVD